MRSIIRLASVCIGFFSTMAVAQIHPVITLGVGSDITALNSTTNITLIAPFFNTYIGNNNNNNTNSVASLFLGAEIPFLSDWALQLGGAYYVSDLQPSGTVYQFGDPLYANLLYNYYILSQRFLFQTKLLYTVCEHFHPFISAGVGEVINKAYDYTEIGVTSADVGMLTTFANKTMHSFTYAAGLGVEMDVAANLRFGLAYNYSDLGQAGLGVSAYQDSNTTLNYNHLKNSEFMMQLSYVG